MLVPHRGQEGLPGATTAPQREQEELSGVVIDAPD
jgi:hypothetical protein